MQNNKITKNKVEERDSVRKDVLDTFQIFLTMPHFGTQKISISDMSRKGLSFVSEPGLQLDEGMKLDCYLHLNGRIRVPLKIKVIHLENDLGCIKAGCSISEKEASAYRAYSNFVQLLMSLTEFKKD